MSEAAGDIQRWRARLERSRARLLGSLRDVTERDFAQPIGDETVVQALAGLAPAERDDIEVAARAADATLGERPGGRVPAKPLPPQVMHDLAGARYETARFLSALPAHLGPDVAAAVEAAVEAVAQREEALAVRIEGRATSASGGSP